MKRFFPSRPLSAFGLLAVAVLLMGAVTARQRYLKVDTLEVVTSLTNAGTITQTGALTQTGAASFNGDVTLGNAAADLVTVTGTVQGASPLVFEGATADAFELTVAVADVTADRTQTKPNATGTYMIAFASGTDAVASGQTSKATTVTGALSTDQAIVTLREVATNNVSLRAAIITADTLTVTVSGDPGASNLDYDYVIIRD